MESSSGVRTVLFETRERTSSGRGSGSGSRSQLLGMRD